MKMIYVHTLKTTTDLLKLKYMWHQINIFIFQFVLKFYASKLKKNAKRRRREQNTCSYTRPDICDSATMNLHVCVWPRKCNMIVHL